MTETIKTCYCDILSEHNNEKVPGATTYKDVAIMTSDSQGKLRVSRATLDMCADCYAKYKINLRLSYDYLRRPVFDFVNETTDTSSNS